MLGPVRVSSQAYASPRSGKSSPLMSFTTPLLIAQFCSGLEADNCCKLHKHGGISSYRWWGHCLSLTLMIDILSPSKVRNMSSLN
jgi:hypothetical protein